MDQIGIPTVAFIGPTAGYQKVDKGAFVGGAELYLFYFAKTLGDLGYNVKIIQPWNKDETFSLQGLANVKIQGIQMPNLLKPQIEFNFFWKNKVDIEEYDHIHFHNIGYAFPYAETNMTGTCHGVGWDCPKNEVVISDTVYEKYFGPIKEKYMMYKVHYALKKLNGIISVDNMLLKYVQMEKPEYRNKIEVIYNFVDTDLFNPENIDSTHNKYAYLKEDNPIIILYPRNISFIRGIHLIMNAMRMLVGRGFRNVKLIITGTGPEETYAMNFVKKNGLSDFVHFVGHIDHFKEMPLLLSIADIVVIPSYCSEGTSLSCLEALSMAKPLVVTNIGGLTDIISHGETGMISKPTSEGITDALVCLIQNESYRNKLGINGRASVSKKFSYRMWRDNVEHFVDSYFNY